MYRLRFLNVLQMNPVVIFALWKSLKIDNDLFTIVEDFDSCNVNHHIWFGFVLWNSYALRRKITSCLVTSLRQNKFKWENGNGFLIGTKEINRMLKRIVVVPVKFLNYLRINTMLFRSEQELLCNYNTVLCKVEQNVYCDSDC